MMSNQIYEAFRHAESCFPNESCGFVIGNQYVPCDNIHSEPLNNFEISDEIVFRHINEIDAIIHSHNNSPHASEDDMAGQIRSNIPWGIINVKNGISLEINWLGLPGNNLYGRKFINGCADCFSFAQDYYAKNHGISIKSYPHSIDFWKQEKNLIIENFEDADFVEVNKKSILPGDALIYKLGDTKVSNHIAIYMGGGLIAHHLANKPSRREPITILQDHLTHVLRHKKYA